MLPVLGAAIGWMANSLLIRLLFRPTTPINLFGLRIQGVLPKRRPELAKKLGKAVKENMVNLDQLTASLTDPANMEKISPLVEMHIDKFLKEKLPNEMPMISLLISDKTIGKLKAVFMGEINAMFPNLMEQYAGNLKEKIDLEKMVVDKLSSFSDAQVEAMLKSQMANELGKLKLCGAIVGLLIGLVMLSFTFVLA